MALTSSRAATKAAVSGSTAALSLAFKELQATGKTVLRNAPIIADADMARVASAVWGNVGTMSSYKQGTTTREQLADGVLAVNLEPPELPVTQHTEMTYLDSFPGYIAFYAKVRGRLHNRKSAYCSSCNQPMPICPHLYLFLPA